MYYKGIGAPLRVLPTVEPGYARPLKKSFTMGFFARWFSNWWRIPLAARDCDGRNGNAPSAKAAGFFSHGYDPRTDGAGGPSAQAGAGEDRLFLCARGDPGPLL